MSEFDAMQAQRTRIERAGAEMMAERIVARLFVNGFGDQADRISLRQRTGDTEADLGGWNRDAAREQIIAAILER